MANQYKGDYHIEGTELVLRYDFNSLCEIEEQTGVNLVDALARMDKPRLGDVRLFFWGGLTHSHPNLTIKEAGDLISQIGLTVARVAVTMALARGLSLKGADEKEEEESGEVGAVEVTG